MASTIIFMRSRLGPLAASAASLVPAFCTR